MGSPILGGFAGHTGVRKGRRYSNCSYKGMPGVANMDIERWRSSKQLRTFVKDQERAGARHLNLGDRGAIAENRHAHGDLCRDRP